MIGIVELEKRVVELAKAIGAVDLESAVPDEFVVTATNRSLDSEIIWGTVGSISFVAKTGEQPTNVCHVFAGKAGSIAVGLGFDDAAAASVEVGRFGFEIDSMSACDVAEAALLRDPLVVGLVRKVAAAAKADSETAAAIAKYEAGLTKVCKIVSKYSDADENGDLRLVTGVVLEPDVADSQKETYDADEVRKTAHLWMLEFQNVGLQHRSIINHGVKPVESWIAPVDFVLNGETVKAGTWLLTVKVFDDEMWSAVKKGELTGFSIGGLARRVPVSDV